jgi:hypothetical protein
MRALTLVLAFVLAAPSAAPGGPEEKPVPAPKISVEPASFDFGKALPRRTLEKQFSIRNFGDADLVIGEITTTCGCTAALLERPGRTGQADPAGDARAVLKPGESAQLRVRLETRDYSGRLVRSVLVRSNDPKQKVLEVRVEALVTDHSRGR